LVLEEFGRGLWVMVAGMGMVFVALLAIWLAMVVLGRIFPAKEDKT
tara:strand:- start:103 stop:240 length:138 start_codon:yes stop_codon:yes gene_type:complete